jgi:hypothetical protein
MRRLMTVVLLLVLSLSLVIGCTSTAEKPQDIGEKLDELDVADSLLDEARWQELDGLGVGRGVVLSGNMVAGDETDLVMKNSLISLALAAAAKDSLRSVGAYIEGKPVDMCYSGMEDSLQWIDMPYVSAGLPSGNLAYRQGTVENHKLTVVEASFERIVVRAEGVCSDIPALSVVTEYTMYEEEPWVYAESMFINNSSDMVQVYVGDVLGLGKETSTIVPGIGEVADYTPAEFRATEPWMASYVPGQVLGLVYARSSLGMEFYGSALWMMSRMPMQIESGQTVCFGRYLVCVSTEDARKPELAMSTVSSMIQHQQLKLHVSLEPDDDNVTVGSSVKVAVSMENKSDSDFGPGQVKLCATSPSRLGAVQDVKSFPVISPYQAYDLEFRVDAKQVGNLTIGGYVISDTYELIIAPLDVIVGGAGWYYGDTHMHSTHSDGKGTVAENVGVARRKGLSFLISTDHNTVSQKNDVRDENRKGFVSILGNEITTSRGHGNALFVSKAVTTSRGFQYAIDKTIGDGGLFEIRNS